MSTFQVIVNEGLCQTVCSERSYSWIRVFESYINQASVRRGIDLQILAKYLGHFFSCAWGVIQRLIFLSPCNSTRKRALFRKIQVLYNAQRQAVTLQNTCVRLHLSLQVIGS